MFIESLEYGREGVETNDYQLNDVILNSWKWSLLFCILFLNYRHLS